MGGRDWIEWHRDYEDPASALSWRLRTVQRQIRDTLDTAPAGPIGVASLCAGDGRDILGVLADHPRTLDVHGLLVEQHPDLAAGAREHAESIGANLGVVTGDAANTDHLAFVVPVDLLLLCGIFGNISDDDIAQTVRALPGICRTGATVIWTRHRRPPDLTPTIRRWFVETELTEVQFDCSPQSENTVGVNRYEGDPRPLATGLRLFQFR